MSRLVEWQAEQDHPAAKDALLEGRSITHNTLIKKKSTLYDLTSDFDVFLTSHENQDVARRKREVDLQDLFYSTVYIIFTRRLRMKHLHRERSTRNSISRCVSVEIGELGNVNLRTNSAEKNIAAYLVSIHRCRSNNKFEVPSASEN